MKNSAAIDHLDREAQRFTSLAKDLALNVLKNPDGICAFKNKRQAEDHLVRAETFKDAARIVAGHSSNRKSK